MLQEQGYLATGAAAGVEGAFWRAKQERDAKVHGRRQVTVHLPVNALAAVDRLAAADGVSRSAAVAALLADALHGKPPHAAQDGT